MFYYQKILAITEDYLGPAAGRFVNRQIASHLKKAPAEIQRNDLPMLALRIRSGLVVLTRDQRIVDEAFRRLNDIEQSNGESLGI
jgi:hypothetical protein